MIRLASISLVASIMTGCASLGIGDKSDFSCANIPDSGACLPVSQLDKLSENTDGQIVRSDLDASEASNANVSEAKVINKPEKVQPRIVMPTLDSPVAIMSAPLVLRTYIGPWRSDKTLYGSSYAFTTVKESDFSFGIQHETDTTTLGSKLYALQVEQRQEKPVAEEAKNILEQSTPHVKQALEVTKEAYLPK